jgi:hypothetical protein
MGICSVGLLLIFSVINPVTAPAFILILPFVLLTVLLFTSLSFLFYKKGLPVKRGRRIAALCTGLPMIILVLQSIGQLTMRDVISIGVVFLLSYFYISRLTSVPAE